MVLDASAAGRQEGVSCEFEARRSMMAERLGFLDPNNTPVIFDGLHRDSHQVAPHEQLRFASKR